MREIETLEISSPGNLKAMMCQISDDIRESVYASDMEEKDHCLKSLQVLSDGLDQLMNLLIELHKSSKACEGVVQLSKIANTGLELLSSMAALASELGLEQQCRQINSILLLTAVWLGRAGARLHLSQAMVEVLSQVAGSNSDDQTLVTLSKIINELVDAVASDAFDDQIPDNWYAINMCWMMVSLRTHQPQLIEAVLQKMSALLGDHLHRLLENSLSLISYGELDSEAMAIIERYRQQAPGSSNMH